MCSSRSVTWSLVYQSSLASSKVIGISVAPELGIVMEGSLKNKNYTFDLPLLILIISRFS